MIVEVAANSQYSDSHISDTETVETVYLTAHPRLITIDGPDGVGKSRICRLLVELLKKMYGQDRVILVSPNSFAECLGSEKLRRTRDLLIEKRFNYQTDHVYVANFALVYKEVIFPALNEGKIVIIDRSEVDSLRFACENYTEKQIEERRIAIEQGHLTHGLWAGVRIFVSGSAEDIWDNLQRKIDGSKNDPQNLVEVRKRIAAQEMAEKQILGFSFQGVRREIRVQNPNVREELLETHLLNMVNNIIALLGIL